MNVEKLAEEIASKLASSNHCFGDDEQMVARIIAEHLKSAQEAKPTAMAFEWEPFKGPFHHKNSEVCDATGRVIAKLPVYRDCGEFANRVGNHIARLMNEGVDKSSSDELERLKAKLLSMAVAMEFNPKLNYTPDERDKGRREVKDAVAQELRQAVEGK